ncbi:MAG: 2-C-methyl-D-erythritol 4-phosphate cytidylyltransferase [Bradymonadales bacterium]|nr:MAG: 2-C-methyl-D-erythritol 4-phosphate cytidylyltransferase [Bradymonadales bacterium]
MTPETAVSAVVVSAGSSQRFVESVGESDNKAFHSKALCLLGGRPVLHWALDSLFQIKIEELVLVVSLETRSAFEKSLEEYGKLEAELKIVEGGLRRQDSVRKGLAALRSVPFVLVHDAARPIFRGSYLKTLLQALERYPAALPCLQIADTVVSATEGGIQPSPLDRSHLRRAQTPQAFRLSVLKELHDSLSASDRNFTDDISLFIEKGFQVAEVEGDPYNTKITRFEDLKLLEALVSCGIV